MTSITEHNDQIKKEISGLAKPLSSYQLYCQAMREQWGNMSEEEKDIFIKKAREEKDNHQEKREDILKKAREKLREKKIFLRYSTGRVPCVGLDNGFSTYTIVGPVGELEVFTDAEKQKLIEKGVPEKKIGKYKSVGGRKFNWRAARKWGATVYGGSQNYKPCWGGLMENYEGEAGNFTDYHNYKGETWTTNY